MNRNPVIAIVAIAIIALSVLGAGYFAGPSSTRSGQTESISIGTVPAELAGLIYISDDRGFFYRNGLNVTIQNYDSALSAVAGMERGEVDLSLSSEYPVIAEVLGSANISVFGSIDKYQTTYLVGMKDRGIQNRSDVAGKKIGVTHRSVGEFYLGRFLNLHGMNLRDVTLVDLKPAQVQDALADRSIDAAVIWNIDPERVQEQFGSNVVIWASQGGQPTFGIVAGRNDRIANRSVTISRFLRSIDEAEQYAISHPAEARAIVQRRVNATDAHMEASWSRHQFTLTLDQSLITAMEGEARWMIANNMTEEKTIPDFRKYIDTGSLEEIKPGSVRIIG